MAMPVINSSNSNSNQQLGFTAANNINNHRSSLSLLMPSRINGGEPVNGVGQLGPSVQNVTELRQSFVTPEGVRIERVTEFYPVRNHSALPVASGVSVTEILRTSEIVRTRLLSASSTRERAFTITTQDARGPSLQNREGMFTTQTRSLLMQRNQVGHSDLTPLERLYNPFNYGNSSPSQSQKIICYPSSHSQSQAQQRRARNLPITELDESTNNAQGNGILDPTPVSVHFPPKPINPSVGDNLRKLNRREKIDEPNRNYNGDLGEDDDKMVISDDDDDDDEYDIGIDGVNHSLHPQKYGPYTCPRCLKKFSTSQVFAAHANTHYKYETRSQRRRRLLARIRRRNVRLHQLRDGLTVLPVSDMNMFPYRLAQRKERPTVVAEAEGDVGGHDQAAPPGKAANNGDGLFDVPIKEEPANF